jgi:hypothetical protein
MANLVRDRIDGGEESGGVRKSTPPYGLLRLACTLNSPYSSFPHAAHMGHYQTNLAGAVVAFNDAGEAWA